MSLRSLKFAVLAAPFLLAACGEGYEQIRTDSMFPYGNQRTAGSQVAYVVAKMMPKRELNLNIVERKQEVTPAPTPAPAPVAAKTEDVSVVEDKMEELFDEALKK